jgi:hypothetical protein
MGNHSFDAIKLRTPHGSGVVSHRNRQYLPIGNGTCLKMAFDK